VSAVASGLSGEPLDFKTLAESLGARKSKTKKKQKKDKKNRKSENNPIQAQGDKKISR
jgi:hypothetical protein